MISSEDIDLGVAVGHNEDVQAIGDPPQASKNDFEDQAYIYYL